MPQSSRVIVTFRARCSQRLSSDVFWAPCEACEPNANGTASTRARTSFFMGDPPLCSDREFLPFDCRSRCLLQQLCLCLSQSLHITFNADGTLAEQHAEEDTSG